MIEVAHTVYKNAMNECSFFLYKCWAFCIINAIFPFLTCFPYLRSPLKGNPRRPLRVGTHSALA